MPVLDHWHPLLLSCDLGRKPVGVRLDGHEIALFRTPAGVAALDDVCPHRRMRLSLGNVVGDKLQCRYHGWTFDACGAGESPGTPKLTACATAYEAREEHGAVWVRGAGGTSAFPTFDLDGFCPTGVLLHRIKAPLELVLDNFCEIEHAATTHDLFGFELARMNEAKLEYLPAERSVRVVNSGPAKAMPRYLRFILGVPPSYHFHDDWTTHFDPPRNVVDHWWQDPDTGARSRVAWRFLIFFTPLGPGDTAVTTFSYARSNWRVGPSGGVRLFRWLMRRKADTEIRKDVFVLENLADQGTGIDGLKLSRFDKVLGLNRERLRSVYRGDARGPVALPTVRAA